MARGRRARSSATSGTDAGRTLADVAEEAGVSTQYLSEIERGRKEPSSEVLQAVAGALGLRLVDLTIRVAPPAQPGARAGLPRGLTTSGQQQHRVAELVPQVRGASRGREVGVRAVDQRARRPPRAGRRWLASGRASR